MPAAAASVRMIQRAVPRSSASAPNTAVQASRSTRSPVTPSACVTLTRSLSTVAAGFTASDICFTDSNIQTSPQVRRPAAYFSTGNSKSSTADAASAARTISSIGSAASASRHLIARHARRRMPRREQLQQS